MTPIQVIILICGFILFWSLCAISFSLYRIKTHNETTQKLIKEREAMKARFK